MSSTHRPNRTSSLSISGEKVWNYTRTRGAHTEASRFNVLWKRLWATFCRIFLLLYFLFIFFGSRKRCRGFFFLDMKPSHTAPCTTGLWSRILLPNLTLLWDQLYSLFAFHLHAYAQIVARARSHHISFHQRLDWSCSKHPLPYSISFTFVRHKHVAYARDSRQAPRARSFPCSGAGWMGGRDLSFARRADV